MTFSTVAWIVAAALCGSTFLISATQGTSIALQKFRERPSFNTSNDVHPSTSETELLQRIRTSIALQKFRERPSFNTSNDVHPSTSETELLQRISKFSRRSKRDSADAVTAAIAGLNILGIAVVAAEPVSGSLILILATLLQLVFSGNNDPKKSIQDVVWNERIKQQKLKLNSIRYTMNEIKRQYNNTTDKQIPQNRMLALYDILNTESCLFMHDDNIEASADYFSEFAFIHITVNQAVILIYPDEPTYQESLVRIVKGYVAYAKHAQQIETQNNYNRADRYNDQSRATVTRVRSLLDPHIQKWTKQLPAHLQSEVNKQGLIRNEEVVSFQLTSKPGYWMSCWVSGSECYHSTCPGQDNPMIKGSQYEYYWKCRGEIFWIESIDDTDGFIRSCSRVGIWYSKNDKGYWWVSGNCAYWTGCSTKTMTCPGDKASNMRHRDCTWEMWKIYANDKPCGHTIQDRDVINLVGHQNQYPIINYYFGIYFTIFRSNVDHGEHTKDLMCRG